ncbi:AAA family ATPase [Kineosporia sp. J2-2]|uniref:AAA family ATPase n=1 Tax=Kineosporia corallincola TaxID=2835133 RepID=A0ABS5TKB7_9ACTN|nr:AAA family ATPase [Kineosporia corallincola]MBT0771543.1 AAA family ATPase [Kineosporia corallincola]
MTRLVLLNGAPASGKSTLAKVYLAARPMTLGLDVDTVRGMLGGWLERPVEAGLAARELAVAMARVHLLAGHDVLVPQYLGRLDFVLRLETLAGETGVPFVEIALVSDAADAVARFGRRATAPQTQEHRDAAALQERVGGAGELAQMHERLLAVIAARPATRTVVTVDGDVEGTYQRLVTALGETG